MGWWDRFRERVQTDRIDGYEPAPPSHQDPWKTSAIVRELEHRVKLTRLDSEAMNLDGFKNELTGIGDWSQDKTFGGKRGGPDFEVSLLPGVACENRWRGSDLGGRIIETIPDEMTREGWDIGIQPSEGDDEPDDKADDFPPGGDAPPAGLAPPPPKNPKPIPEADEESTQQIEELDGLLEQLSASDAIWQALCYERAYGGGAILIGADDGMDDLAQPLNEKSIKSVRFLNPVSGGWDGELVAWSYYRDLNSPNYGMPEIYMLRNLGVPIARIPAPGSTLTAADIDMLPRATNLGYGPLIQWVHESRLLIFPGIAVSHRARVQMRGWGDSVFTRVDRVLQQYDQTWGGIANLLTDFSQGMLKVDGLSQMLGGNNKNGSKNLLTRARMLQLTRSISRILLIDKLEDFSRDTASIAGIAETMQQFALRLAAAADMPVALLMGQAPAGLNATGASDIRFFYDRVAARQKKRMLPQLRRLIKLLMLSKEGPTSGSEPEKWNVEFNSLYQMTDLEKAQLRLSVAQTDQIYINAGVLSPEEIAASAFAGTEWSMERSIDFAGRQEMADQDEADKKAKAKAMLEGAKKPPDGSPPAPGGAPPAGGDKPPSAPGHMVKVEITPSGDGGDKSKRPFDSTDDLHPIVTVAQTNDYNCGAAALLSVLKSFGQVPPNLSDDSAVDKLAESLGTTPEHGTTPEDIVRVAGLFNIPARWAIGVSVDALRAALAADAPVILDLQEPDGDVLPGSPDGHYVVLTELNQDAATVMNPSGGTFDRMPLGTLLDRWIDEEGRYGAIFFERARSDAGEWEESKHPRDPNGKFGSGGGVGGGAGSGRTVSISGPALLDRAVKREGFTLDLAKRKFAYHGYSVSVFPQHERVFQAGKKVTGADLKAYIKDKLEFIKKTPGAHVGVWHDLESGKWYLDVSKVVASRKEAKALAHTHNQEGIFWLDKGKTIITKAKAKRRL